MKAGFILIELLVVIGILGLLATVLLPAVLETVGPDSPHPVLRLLKEN